MPLNSRLERLQRDLHRAPSKLHGLFKVTDFDRLLHKIGQKQEYRANNRHFTLNSIIKSGLIRALLQNPSQRQFTKILDYSPFWRQICEFQNDLPHQSSFSRFWNSSDVLSTLEHLFEAYQTLIPLRRLRNKIPLPKHLVPFQKLNFQVLILDSTMINLSPARFDYATRVYHLPRGKNFVGAKLQLVVDGFYSFPIIHRSTQAHEHDSKYRDEILENLFLTKKKWFKNANQSQLRPLLLFDKGYWNQKRFWSWTQKNIYFICPKRRKTFTRAHFELLEFPVAPNQPNEILIWRADQPTPLRWIWQFKTSPTSSRWEVVTNNLEIDNKMIFQLYSQRWPIEEAFKWIKQHLRFSPPPTNSWIGLLIHIYFILLLFLIFLLFLYLMGYPRWQDNLTNIWLQIYFSPLEPWRFRKLQSRLLVY